MDKSSLIVNEVSLGAQSNHLQSKSSLKPTNKSGNNSVHRIVSSFDMRSTSVLNPDTSQLKLLPQITSRNNNATFMQKSKNNSPVSIRKPSIDMSTIVPHYVDSQAFQVAASPSQDAKKFVAKLPESLK